MTAAVDGNRQRPLLLLGGNKRQLAHSAQHVGAALRGCLGAGDRVQDRGSPRDPRDDGRIGEADLAEGLAEVSLRRGGDAVGVLAEERRVEVDIENFLLGKLAFDPDRKNPFLEFPYQRPVAGQKVQSGDLLGNGAAALIAAAGIENEIQRRPQRALVVDPGVVEETVVLGGQHRLNHHRRYSFDGNRGSPFAELRNQAAVAAVDGQGDLDANVTELFCLRETGSHIVIAAGNQGADSEQSRSHEGSEGA